MKKRLLSLLFVLAAVISLVGAMAVTASAANNSISVNTSNWYGIKNVASGRYLNVYGNGNANNVNVTLWDWDGTSGVYYKFSKSGSNYVITPKCATGRAINVYGNSAKAGSNVCIWSKTGHSTQAWTIEYVPAQKGFLFRSANNKNVALAAAGKGNGSNVCLKQYNVNDTYQIWKCDGITAKEVTTTSETSAAADSTLKISPGKYPSGNLTIGSSYSLTGKVTSNYKITSVKGEILTSAGKAAQTPVTVYPNSTSYKIDGGALDRQMYFNKLSAGTYYIRYTATDTSGKTVTWGSASASSFKVVSPNPGNGTGAETVSASSIRTQITNTYAAAKKTSGFSSFNGWCGAYVQHQLNALGIIQISSDTDCRGNGNQWYSNVKAGKTSTGYTKTKLAGGADCLSNIVKTYGNNITNIVISYPYQYGYSYQNPGAGHVVLIHAIIGGTVYYSECYSPEGTVRTSTAAKFDAAYRNSYGNALGAIYFHK